MTIQENEAAEAFAALGNRTRLKLLRLLVRAGDEGLGIGAIQAYLRLPASTLAHHLESLTSAGLVKREPRGREVICTATFGRLRAASAYLLDSCCVGVADGGTKKTGTRA